MAIMPRFPELTAEGQRDGRPKAHAMPSDLQWTYLSLQFVMDGLHLGDEHSAKLVVILSIIAFEYWCRHNYEVEPAMPVPGYAAQCGHGCTQ